MKAKTLYVLGAMVLASSVIYAASTEPSQAGRKYCSYAAIDVEGRRIDEGAGARKMSTACKRARRQCNRILEWKRKRKRFGRTTGCQKIKMVGG
ncbi:MAG: hypothetical protein ABJN26_15765 [Stappiaceae bacterium]